MTTIISTRAIEESTYVIDLAFKDEDDAEVIPLSATWTLTNTSGTIVNSRLNVVISPMAATATIVLSGDDLALASADVETRVLLVESTYNSNLGNNLPNKEECRFEIENLVAHPE